MNNWGIWQLFLLTQFAPELSQIYLRMDKDNKTWLYRYRSLSLQFRSRRKLLLCSCWQMLIRFIIFDYYFNCSMSEIDFHREYKIYKTVLKLLTARCYLVPEQKLDMSFEQFKKHYQDRPEQVQIFFHIDQAAGNIAVSLNLKRYDDKHKITKQFTEQLLKKFGESCNHIFIVTKTEGKNSTLAVDRKALQVADLAAKLQNKVYIEFFKEQNLMFNILEHELVPRHSLLSKAEKQALLVKYKVKDSQLPKILLTDPVAEFLGLKRGEVVKIIRKSETAGTYITYRIAS